MRNFDNYIVCSDIRHQNILHLKQSQCPLCKQVELNSYYYDQCTELKVKYETLYKTALEFSPEILL